LDRTDETRLSNLDKHAPTIYGVFRTHLMEEGEQSNDSHGDGGRSSGNTGFGG